MNNLNWRGYWERLEDNQKIFRIEAEDYVARLEGIINLADDLRVLDFGCGFGYVTFTISPKIGEIYIWDEADSMRARARKNVGDLENVICPAEVGEFIDLKFDLILVNSVIQYMQSEDFTDWLGLWHEMLADDGKIIISDIISDETNSWTDMASLIPFSFQNGFLLRAIWEGLKELRWYSSLRRVHPLRRMNQDEIEIMAKENGLECSILSKNLTFRKGRIAAIFSAK